VKGENTHERWGEWYTAAMTRDKEGSLMQEINSYLHKPLNRLSRTCHNDCCVKGREERSFSKADTPGIDSSFGRDRFCDANSHKEERCLSARKSIPALSPEPSMSDPSPPVFPEQHVFHALQSTLIHSTLLVAQLEHHRAIPPLVGREAHHNHKAMKAHPTIIQRIPKER